MWKYIFFQPFLLLLIGCHLQPAQSPETSCIYSRDTVIAGKEYTFFGQDSIYEYLYDKQHKVIYIHTDPVDKIHYMVYDSLNRVTEIAWTRDTIVFNSEYPGFYERVFPLSDEFIRYYENNTIRQKGFLSYDNEEADFVRAACFVEEYEVYDREGRLTEKFKGAENLRGYKRETFYPDGKPNELQIHEFSRQMISTYKRWAPEGWLEEAYECDESFPDGNFTTGLFIMTTRLYYPNGKIKQIFHEKMIGESQVCPCGKWIYYNQSGKVTHQEDYPPCSNYELECD